MKAAWAYAAKSHRPWWKMKISARLIMSIISTSKWSKKLILLSPSFYAFLQHDYYFVPRAPSPDLFAYRLCGRRLSEMYENLALLAIFARHHDEHFCHCQIILWLTQASSYRRFINEYHHSGIFNIIMWRRKAKTSFSCRPINEVTARNISYLCEPVPVILIAWLSHALSIFLINASNIWNFSIDAAWNQRY